MADNFFGFSTDIKSQINILGRHTMEEELLIDVEDEYDALNDETFGHAANDDWEEAHEQLSELIKQNNLAPKSIFNDSLLEHDNSQDEIVSKSISQLGLEDDLDDPAIMTISRNCHSTSHPKSVFGSSSPPPPAILETLDCGSPKTHSIWSTTPKDSGITSFLQSIGQNNFSQNSPASFNSSSDNVFTTPPKAWRAEELERDLLSKESAQQHAGRWPSVPEVNRTNQNNCISRSPPRPPNLGQYQNKVATDRMLTREEVERQMHADPRMRFPPPNVQNNFVPPQMMPPMLQQNLMSPIGSPRPTALNQLNHSSPVLPLRPTRGPMLGNNCPMPDPYLFMKARMGNMMHNRMPLRGPTLPNLPPGFSPPNMNINHKLLNFPPRSIAHPLLNKHFQFPMVYHNKYYGNEDLRNMSQHEDEYAGLMTQREKEWLIRIQLLLLKTENPYVEDYYFTTQVARRCRKQYSESANKGAGDALILPQTTKHENKTYVPTQFEGSLGKLQAVSVNFPRKVLDITVTRPLEDEEGKIVTNQSLLKYRRLLIDIEKMYTNLLEIEDEERRILAKPESESGPHEININKYIQNIYNSLFNDSQEDNFQHVMTIRKGRSLLMRIFKMFNKEQQLHCLSYMFQCLSLILKKDQNDHILLQHKEIIIDAIDRFDSLSDLVQLSDALDKDSPSDQITKIDKSNLAAALKYKFGSFVIYKMLMKAEQFYCTIDLNESDVQIKWSKFVLHAVDCLCLLPTSALSPPEVAFVNVLAHIQRFSVDNEKVDVLREKLTLLENDSQTRITGKTV